MAAVCENCNESLYLLRPVQKDVKKRVPHTNQESTSPTPSPPIPPETTAFVVLTLIDPHTKKNQEEPKETFNKERVQQALASASMTVTEKALSNSKPHSFHSLPLLWF